MDWGTAAGKLVDTAGLRRRANVVERLEAGDRHRPRAALRPGGVPVLDATQPMESRTGRSRGCRRGRALVIAISKWDLRDRQPAMQRFRDRLNLAAAGEGSN
jgi:predicted GTPase